MAGLIIIRRELTLLYLTISNRFTHEILNLKSVATHTDEISNFMLKK